MLFGNTRCTRVSLDDVPESLARHAVAPSRREQVVSLTLEQNLAARAVEELGQPAHRLFAQGDQPLAVALTHDANDTLVEVNLPVAEVDELRDAQTGGVENFEHRAIAIAQGVADERCPKQRLDLFFGQRLG